MRELLFRVLLAVTVRSPCGRIVVHAGARGWRVFVLMSNLYMSRECEFILYA